MSRPILNELDEIRIGIDGIQNLVGDFQIRVLGTIAETDSNRVIAYYMQPHARSMTAHPTEVVSKPTSGGIIAIKSVWGLLRDSELAHEDVWGSYRSNLEMVLEAIELLSQNIGVDDVIVTSGYENAVREFGIYGPLAKCL